jgi:hypothetical protein
MGCSLYFTDLYHARAPLASAFFAAGRANPADISTVEAQENIRKFGFSVLTGGRGRIRIRTCNPQGVTFPSN